MSLDTMIADLEARRQVTLDDVKPLLERMDKGGELSRREDAAVKAKFRESDVLDERIEELKAQRDRQNRIAEARKAMGIGMEERGGRDGAHVSVTNEPMLYGEGAQVSYYRDLIYSSLPGHPASLEARDRLTQYGHEVNTEINLRSEVGRKAQNALRSMTQENRTGITSGGGATATAASGGAAFVSPLIFIDDYAPYRQFGRAFADRCNKQQLPDYGMELYLPAVTAPAGESYQTEADAVDESDPTFGYLSSTLTTIAGQVTVTQQLLDRAGPGFEFDKMIFDQLNRAYAPKVDDLVFTAALANAQTITWNGSYTITTASGSGGLYEKVAYGKNLLATTDGTVLNADTVAMTPARWNYTASFADADGRPLVVPGANGVFNSVTSGGGNAPFEGDTGYSIQGVPIITDNNLPPQGTTTSDQIIVANCSEIYLWESTPVQRVVPQTLASTLQCIVQVFGYAGVIARYPSGTAVITGTALTAPTFS